MEKLEPSTWKTRWPRQRPSSARVGCKACPTRCSSRCKTARGKRARAWQYAEADQGLAVYLNAIQMRPLCFTQGDELHGMFCIHEGDDSEFVAQKGEKKKGKKGK